MLFRSQLKGIALTIQAGGVGLTLTRAWKALFVDLDWTPSWNSQAEDRICRIGQTKPVEIVHMVSDHVLDIHIHDLLSYKIKLFNQTVDASIAVNPVQSREADSETEEQYTARIARIEDELKAKDEARKKEIGLQKVGIIIEREIARLQKKTEFVSLNLPTSFSEEQQKVIADALKSMLKVCDGAMMRDSQG